MHATAHLSEMQLRFADPDAYPHWLNGGLSTPTTPEIMALFDEAEQTLAEHEDILTQPPSPVFVPATPPTPVNGMDALAASAPPRRPVKEFGIATLHAWTCAECGEEHLSFYEECSRCQRAADISTPPPNQVISRKRPRRLFVPDPLTDVVECDRPDCNNRFVLATGLPGNSVALGFRTKLGFLHFCSAPCMSRSMITY